MTPIYLDIVGVLFPKDKIDLLYSELNNEKLFPIAISKQLKILKKDKKLTYKKEMELKEKALISAIKTKKGEKFFNFWLKTNIPNINGLKSNIKEFKKVNKSKIIINSKFSPEISSFISKQIGADGFIEKKMSTKRGFLIDDRRREIKIKERPYGVTYRLPTPSFGKQKQTQLNEHNIQIKPKDLAELLSILKNKEFSNKIKRKTNQTQLEKYGLKFRKK